MAKKRLRGHPSMGLNRTMRIFFILRHSEFLLNIKRRNLEKVDSGAMLKYFMNFAKDIANIALTYKIFYIESL